MDEDQSATGVAGDGVRAAAHGARVALVAGLLAALVAATGLVATGSDRDERGGAATPSLARQPQPEVIESLERFVERERGLEFRRPVRIVLASGREIQTMLEEELEDDRAELEATGLTLRVLGMIAPQDDLVEMTGALLGSGVLGIYEPDRERLVVRGAALTPMTSATIVHELTHALQDQHFDLDRPELDDVGDESALALSALAEGDATRIEEAYRATLSPRERSLADREEQSIAGEAQRALRASGISPAAFVLLLAGQLLGPGVVAALLAAGGDARLDGAFRRPPPTSEQLLDPGRLLAGEAPLAVDTPSADGAVADDGSLGQLGLQLLLQRDPGSGRALDPAGDVEAARAAQGWGGDRYVTWIEDGTPCTRVTWVMDSATDLEELVAALTRWAEPRNGATVARGEGRVSLTACNRDATGPIRPSRLA